MSATKTGPNVYFAVGKLSKLDRFKCHAAHGPLYFCLGKNSGPWLWSSGQHARILLL